MSEADPSISFCQETASSGNMVHVTQQVPTEAEPWPVNVILSDEMKRFVQKKVASGAFPSEEAVLQEAVRRFRQEDQAGGHAGNGEKAADEDLIDYEAVTSCEKEVDDTVTLEAVRFATSKIKDSMARVVIEEERAERF
jgi:Arc/MetJ-type ribon-helix-helix transcriptional regulator